MKEAIDEIKNEVKAKLKFWKNIENNAVKVLLISVFVGLIALKIFSTVLTFDWLKHLFS